MRKIFYTYILFLLSCSTDIPLSEQGKKDEDIIYKPDAERQKDIQDDYNKDDFSFDQFKNIDWSNPKTYGKAGSYVTPTKDPIPNYMTMPEVGINPDDYYKVEIAGDGNCWLRAAIHSILYYVFSDQNRFDYFILKIKEAEKEFKNVPGFLDRFRGRDLIKLLSVFNNSSNSERLDLFNKNNVDQLLIYSFRSFMHAKLNSKIYLKNNEWDAVSYAVLVIADYFLLVDKVPFFYFGFAKIDQKNPEKFNLKILQKFPVDQEDKIVSNFSFNEQINIPQNVKLLRFNNKDELLDELKKDRDIYAKIANEKTKERGDLIEKIRYLLILKYFNLVSFKQLKEKDYFNVFAYRASSANHVNLMINKRAAKYFGLVF